MHIALQLRAHFLQPLHLLVSIIGLNNEKREKKPNTVPTGQKVLHQSLPQTNDNTPITTSVTNATQKVTLSPDQWNTTFAIRPKAL